MAMVLGWADSHHFDSCKPAIHDVTTESFSKPSSCEELHQSTEWLSISFNVAGFTERHWFISWGTPSNSESHGVIIWSDIETLVHYISICRAIHYSPNLHLIMTNCTGKEVLTAMLSTQSSIPSLRHINAIRDAEDHRGSKRIIKRSSESSCLKTVTEFDGLWQFLLQEAT